MDFKIRDQEHLSLDFNIYFIISQHCYDAYGAALIISIFWKSKLRKINSVELDGISERSNFNSQVSIEKYNEELDVTENYDNDITDLNASLHSEIIEEHTEPADESLKTNSVSLHIPGIPDKVLCAIYVTDFEFFHVT